MVGDRLRVLQQALVFQVGGDPGRAKGMIADPGLDAGGGGAALDHPVGILLPHRLRVAGLAPGGAEQRAVRLAGDAGGGDVLVEVAFPECGGRAPRAPCRPFRAAAPSRGGPG